MSDCNTCGDWSVRPPVEWADKFGRRVCPECGRSFQFAVVKNLPEIHKFKNTSDGWKTFLGVEDEPVIAGNRKTRRLRGRTETRRTK